MSFDDFFRSFGKNVRTTDTSFYDKTFPDEITKAIPYGRETTGPGGRITYKPLKAADSFRRDIIPREIRKATPYDDALKDPDVLNGIAGTIAGTLALIYGGGAALGGGGGGGGGGGSGASASAGGGATASGGGATAPAKPNLLSATRLTGGGGDTTGGGVVTKGFFGGVGSALASALGNFITQNSANQSQESQASKERDARAEENARERRFRADENRRTEAFQRAQNQENRVFQLRQAEIQARQAAVEAQSQGARDQALLVAQSLKEEREATEAEQQAFAALIASLRG